ncbi:23S rRNA m(2)A-2503 methyltransferase [Clostridium collagenovorans DSM 3089]|uniref:Probable dual-specificity RNA methyltransferase RlmN n=1 Tax=Clostridium collagenovorans DSM 3089 TaxID=1121306 RepID=A0A1M5SS32_9CLOT|nr:23S rRNA (adenine(2503)-C(2))-methyltransferase RlmN [Clostridium collagenovorans]SHH41339.1 23S rRNA m(2)A-2503 methyltransferase [Clostridium collagenovorans DSM 3089]
MQNILDFTLEELQLWMKSKGQPAFRAKQIFDWIYNKGIFDFNKMTNLPKAMIESLNEELIINIPQVVDKFISKQDDTIKFLMSLHDGNLIESVVMKYSHGNSICISTQIGCRMGCKFCASTIDGMVRNLSSGEIISQILLAQSVLGERISNIVLMGSGEPLDNYENVKKFLYLVNAPYSLNIGQRHITLSTCGIVPNIVDLANEDMQITLAISLHAPNDFIRKQSMPIANKYSISELLGACKYYVDKTNRRITFEYALINGFNDGIKEAEELSKLLKGLLCHVNLIPVNEIKERDFKKSKLENINKFKECLESKGIPTTIRREMGSDINAACGQLRRSYIEKNS